jgi:hypothetical protein
MYASKYNRMMMHFDRARQAAILTRNEGSHFSKIARLTHIYYHTFDHIPGFSLDVNRLAHANIAEIMNMTNPPRKKQND